MLDELLVDIAAAINDDLAELTAVRGNASVRSSLGGGRGQPINFVIAGTSYDGLADARDRILAAAKASDKIPAVHTAAGEVAKERIAQGFTFITIASDLTHLEIAARAHLEAAKS